MIKCDIIIPIYNAYDCVVECIESVIKNTNFDDNRLILIDDKSPDERILPMLKKYSKKYDFIELLENKENLGFVGTVNKGMKYSKNDVLLLNSDTEVGRDWLSNIKETAYSEPKVATVTAISNNATLASVPKGLQRNELPENMDFEEYADLVNKIAYDDSIELPTAHGFCMYIRREALDLVGYFDEEAFGKGYGEENDFSFRCLDYGYKHLLCTKSLVYHKESQSFSSKKEALQKENSAVLRERYPIYTRRIELWCQSFPIRKVCENVDYQIGLHNRKNILAIIHDWNDVENNIGGTTLHLYDLIKNLRSEYNFHVLAPSDGIYKLYSYFKDSEKVTKFPAIDSCNIIPEYSSKYKKMIENICDGFRIDTIHVHHMIGHYFDIIDVAKEKNIHSIISLHDFYSICPTINLLYRMEKSCIGEKNKNCSECLQYKTSIKNNIISQWQKDWKEFLSKFDEVIAPSNSTKSIVNETYKNIKIKVIEHGIDLKKSDYVSNIDDKINIAFVGVMAPHKGSKILEEMIKKYKNSNIKIHLFGNSEIESLKHSTSNYVYHGKYKREELPELLKNNNINLICSLSICAETYSYTLTENIASGIPVLAFDIGAIGERVSKSNLGWIIPSSSNTNEIISEINNILTNKEEYGKVLKSVKDYHIKTTKEMASDYSIIYKMSKIVELCESNAEKLKDILEDNYKVTETVSSAETAWILNSLKWRIVSKIKVPETVKKVIRKVIK